MTANDILISGRQLRPEFVEGNPASAVNIDIQSSSIVGIIGPDMEYKSGWLRVLAGIDSASQGKLEIFGRDVSVMSKPQWQSMRVNLAYLNEESALLSVLSALENILMPSLYHKLGLRDELVQKAKSLLQGIGFEDMENLNSLPAYLDDYAYCQVVIVRALLMNPSVLVLDNVFRKLDAESADKLMVFVIEYVKNHNMTLMFNTSKLKFVMEYANRILFVMQRFMLQFNDRHAIKVSESEEVIQYLQDHYVN